MLGFLAIFILTGFSAAAWLVFYRYIDVVDEESEQTALKALVLGCVSIVPLIFLEQYFLRFPEYNVFEMVRVALGNDQNFYVVFYAFVAFLEEALKALAFIVLVWLSRKEFNQVIDGLIYGAMIGIGFAFIENIHFFVEALANYEWTANFLAIFNIRSFGTMLAHTLFTGMFGLYFAYAYFYPAIDEPSASSTKIKKKRRLKVLFGLLLPKAKEGRAWWSRVGLILLGYVIAVLLHFLFNVFIKMEVFGSGFSLMVVPLVVGAAIYLWGKCFAPLYLRIIEFVPVKK